jgi:hypothetical protein
LKWGRAERNRAPPSVKSRQQKKEGRMTAAFVKRIVM